MNRRIEVRTQDVTITAILHPEKRTLTGGEYETAATELTDTLMEVVSKVRYMGSPLCRVKVRS